MRDLIWPDWAGDFIMKRIRHAAEQITRKLNTVEKLIAQGKNVAEVVCAIEMAAVLRLEDIDERWLPNRLETAAWRQLSQAAEHGVDE